MNKFLRVGAYGLGGLLLLGAGLAASIELRGIPHYAPPAGQAVVVATPARVALGQQLAVSICADCHLNRSTGTLSGQPMPGLPAEFGKIYAANITQDPVHGIGRWTDGQLVGLLRTGVGPDGRYRVVMPSFVQMSDEDVSSLVAFLRSNDSWVKPTPVATPAQEPSFLLKALTNSVMQPTPLPTGPVVAPPASDAVAYGRYLVVGRYKCYDCHSRDLKTNDALHPEHSAGYLGGGTVMLDRGRRPVTTRNLTMDENTGLGDWTEAQFDHATRSGISPHGPLREPMPKFTRMSEAEAAAIWAYLQTVPKVENLVATQAPIGE
ncbi:cytochrome c [Hymenobacter sp. H14-R3]|uniref:c-type cytochrome n=1 Tax=Hymenobacter sp. H14-R3 TaxID=3046308 RepID=UPI0024BB8399|nr:cytochrome c [Hymenobacter sp. H14-R3]MDJ0366496.1 cytochrome c [Hymenobacter sp. H14-R3]